jgi:hypothetical protein
MRSVQRFNANEQGGSRFNFLVVLTLIGVAAYSALQYIPVAYQAFMLKDFMQQEVNIAAGTGKSAEWVKNDLRKHSYDYGIPDDAVITVEQSPRGMTARIYYTRTIPLPFYIYQYEFDHTATSGSLYSN